MLAAGGGGGAAAAAPPPHPANSPYNHLDTLVLPGLTVRMILGIMMCAASGRATLETLVDAGYTVAALLVLVPTCCRRGTSRGSLASSLAIATCKMPT